MMRVALLMGSFDPVHNGHTKIAEYVLGADLADEVWFVVSPQNPFKADNDMAPAADRMEMVRLATAHDSSLVPCDVELSMPRPSYTINTILKLLEIYPDHKFTILAGSDIADSLDRWYRIEELRQLVGFLFYPRGDIAAAAVSPEMASAPRYDISSTAIRSNLAHGRCKPEELAVEVYDYIVAHHLYGVKATTSYYCSLLEAEPERADYYFARGKLNFKLGEFSGAVNDFEKAFAIDPGYVEAREMKNFVEEIINFRYTDIYNP